MLKIQYKLVWNGEDRVDWRDVGSVDIPTNGGSASIEMPAFGQSDLLRATSTYGADATIKNTFNGTFTRDNNNRITMTGGSFTLYQFDYKSSIWGSHIGEAVIKGTYDYYAIPSSGGEEFIYKYDGGNTVVEDYSVSIPSKTVSAEYHEVIQPGNGVSAEHYYGRCFNEINNNNLQVYLRFMNTYPANYRPGKIYDSSSDTWQSHNRNGGWAGIYDGTSFREMQTVGGDGQTTGNAPYIAKDNDWVNQRKIGNNAG